MPSDEQLAVDAMATPGKGVVLSAKYVEHNDADILRVRFSDGAETYTHDIPNGDFTLDNPALQFMGAIGVSPSTLEGARGRYVPIVDARDQDRYGDKALSNILLTAGREMLEQQPWAPDDEAKEIEVVEAEQNT